MEVKRGKDKAEETKETKYLTVTDLRGLGGAGIIRMVREYDNVVIVTKEGIIKLIEAKVK